MGFEPKGERPCLGLALGLRRGAGAACPLPTESRAQAAMQMEARRGPVRGRRKGFGTYAGSQGKGRGA